MRDKIRSLAAAGRSVRALAFCILGLGLITSANAQVLVEYVGHASFVLQSPDGTRIVVDPFSSTRWLGYQFPVGIEVDLVLVSHPHYDHDASYYWGDSTPVFREPGEFRFNDVEFVGVRGKHADPYGKDFEQKNTLWLIELGGLRFLHVGDNGPLTEANIREIGSVDVLMIPADGDDHILSPEAIDSMIDSLSPQYVIPMHYRLDGFLGLPASLGPLEPWLEGRKNIRRLENHQHTLNAADQNSTTILVFDPSPELLVWPESLANGWSQVAEARRLSESTDSADRQRAASLVESALAAHPTINFSYQWSRILADQKKYAEAADYLESALARTPLDDWEYRNRSHLLLGMLYEKLGKPQRAKSQFLRVLNESYRTELIELAREHLQKNAQP